MLRKPGTAIGRRPSGLSSGAIEAPGGRTRRRGATAAPQRRPGAGRRALALRPKGASAAPLRPSAARAPPATAPPKRRISGASCAAITAAQRPSSGTKPPPASSPSTAPAAPERRLSGARDRLAEAHSKHAKEFAVLKAAGVAHASVSERVGYLEKVLGDSADRHEEEIQTLKAAQTKHAEVVARLLRACLSERLRDVFCLWRSSSSPIVHSRTAPGQGRLAYHLHEDLEGWPNLRLPNS